MINSLIYILLTLVTWQLWHYIHKAALEDDPHKYSLNFWRFYFFECDKISCVINWIVSLCFIMSIINIIIELVIK